MEHLVLLLPQGVKLMLGDSCHGQSLWFPTGKQEDSDSLLQGGQELVIFEGEAVKRGGGGG